MTIIWILSGNREFGAEADVLVLQLFVEPRKSPDWRRPSSWFVRRRVARGFPCAAISLSHPVEGDPAAPTSSRVGMLTLHDSPCDWSRRAALASALEPAVIRFEIPSKRTDNQKRNDDRTDLKASHDADGCALIFFCAANRDA